MRTDMKDGRFFSEIEAHGARNVLILGVDVATALSSNESPGGLKARANRRSSSYGDRRGGASG